MWRWEFWVGALLCTASWTLGSGSLESPELAWLLANESPPLSLRRITPKSVFLAPTFTSCSEGYRQDSLGRCVKIVKLNQAAQWDFFLQKLNSMYAPPPVRVEKPSKGPLRLPIPIGEAETTTTTTAVPTTTTSFSTMTSTTADVGRTSTLPPTTAAIPGSGEDTTDFPLLIIVANTTEQLLFSSATLPTSTAEYSTTTDSADTNPTETSAPTTTTTDVTPTVTDQHTRATTVQAGQGIYPTRWPAVRFPSERPTYIRFPSSPDTPPLWWPQTWEQSVWPSHRVRGHREPRPSWIHQ